MGGELTSRAPQTLWAPKPERMLNLELEPVPSPLHAVPTVVPQWGQATIQGETRGDWGPLKTARPETHQAPQLPAASTHSGSPGPSAPRGSSAQKLLRGGPERCRRVPSPQSHRQPCQHFLSGSRDPGRQGTRATGMHSPRTRAHRAAPRAAWKLPPNVLRAGVHPKARASATLAAAGPAPGPPRPAPTSEAAHPKAGCHRCLCPKGIPLGPSKDTRQGGALSGRLGRARQ